jgi:hypothetical protein
MRRLVNICRCRSQEAARGSDVFERRSGRRRLVGRRTGCRSERKLPEHHVALGRLTPRAIVRVISSQGLYRMSSSRFGSIGFRNTRGPDCSRWQARHCSRGSIRRETVDSIVRNRQVSADRRLGLGHLISTPYLGVDGMVAWCRRIGSVA